MKFKVGDKVTIKVWKDAPEPMDNIDHIGKTGIIVEIGSTDDFWDYRIRVGDKLNFFYSEEVYILGQQMEFSFMHED